MALGKKGKAAFNNAVGITESAILVMEALNGKFDNLQDGMNLDVSGMSGQQFLDTFNALLNSGKSFNLTRYDINDEEE